MYTSNYQGSKLQSTSKTHIISPNQSISNNMILKPTLQNGQSSDRSMEGNNLNSNTNSSSNFHKVANLFTNQLQSQQQQQQYQQYAPQTIQQKYINQQTSDSRNLQQPSQILYESTDLQAQSQKSPYSSPYHGINQPSLIAQNSVQRNQSPYSGNNSYLFSNGGNAQNLGGDKQINTINLQQINHLSNNYNYLNSSTNSVKCHSATNIPFELRDLHQERQNMKAMSNNYSGTEENSPMSIRTADRLNFHRQREMLKISRQNSEDQNRKMHQIVNEMEGTWNQIKKDHNLDNRSSSPFNNSLNSSTMIAPKIGSAQLGQQRLSEQINKEQWNTQQSDNNSIHDQSYDATLKTQGSIKSLTSSCKRVRTQGDSTNSNNSLNKIISTPSRKQKDQSTSSIKKTQIINKSIPLSKINLDQVRTNSYSSRSNGEQVTQYNVKQSGQRQNSSQISNRNSLNNSNSLIQTNASNNNGNGHSSIQNKSPISRNSSQDEFTSPKSPDNSTFLKIKEKYSNVHKQKNFSKQNNQESSNQSINLSTHQAPLNNSYNTSQSQINAYQTNSNYNSNNMNNQNYSNNPNSMVTSCNNYIGMQQQNSDAMILQQLQKNSFSDLSVSPHQSQIMSQQSQQNIGNGCSTLHQYPSILSQGSTYQQNQQFQQPQMSPLPIQRYASSSMNVNNQISSHHDLANQSQNQQDQQHGDMFIFNAQGSGANAVPLKSPQSYRTQTNSYSLYNNSNFHQNHSSTNNSANNSFSAKQLLPYGIKNKELESTSKPQLLSGPSSMQSIQINNCNQQQQQQSQQTMNFLIHPNYLVSQTSVNTPSCSNSSAQKKLYQNRQSEQTPMSQMLQSFDQCNNQNQFGQQIQGYNDLLGQNELDQQKQHHGQSQSTSSKEKSIIQTVRASPMKKMISDVKPTNQQQQQIQQSPKQSGLVKGLQGNNNSCSSYNNGNTNYNTNNLSYASSNNYGSSQPSAQANQKKDMTSLIMNKIKKMNIARISLNEEDDLFFQSTDTDSYNQNSYNKNLAMNIKNRGVQNTNNQQGINNAGNDYLQSLQSQDIDRIQKTIQLQQIQQNNQSDFEFTSQQDTQSNNLEMFQTQNPLISRDTVSPRAVPNFISATSNNTNRNSSNNSNILQNQKFFQTNGGPEKTGTTKTADLVYNQLLMYKQKSSTSPVKQNQQPPQQQQENNGVVNSFINSGVQPKESFLAQQYVQKPYINSTSHLQQTPINHKKISNNTNYSQKLLDSIQKHAKITQENQQNIYSSPPTNNTDLKRGIGKVINNTIKKPQQFNLQVNTQIQSQPQQQQQPQSQLLQQQQLQQIQQQQQQSQPLYQEQLPTNQSQLLQFQSQLPNQPNYSQAFKSYSTQIPNQQSQNIQLQGQNPNLIKTSSTISQQQLPQKQNTTTQNIKSTSTHNNNNFNLNSPIAKKIY